MQVVYRKPDAHLSRLPALWQDICRTRIQKALGQELKLSRNNEALHRDVFGLFGQLAEKMPGQIGDALLRAGNHEGGLDYPGRHCRTLFHRQLQQAGLHVHQTQQGSLRAAFQVAHPSVVAGGADVLDDKTAQVMAAKECIFRLIFAMTILLETQVRLFNFVGKPLREDVLP